MIGGYHQPCGDDDSNCDSLAPDPATARGGSGFSKSHEELRQQPGHEADAGYDASGDPGDDLMINAQLLVFMSVVEDGVSMP